MMIDVSISSKEVTYGHRSPETQKLHISAQAAIQYLYAACMYHDKAHVYV